MWEGVSVGGGECERREGVSVGGGEEGGGDGECGRG